MSEAKLGRDVFVALAAIGWADGTLEPDEADAIVRAAIDEGIELDAIGEIEEATKTKVEIGTIDRSTMSKEDRLYVYALACWIARMDGKVTDAETAAVGKLAERLGVPERPRASVEKIVKDVAELPDGDRPAQYDLSAMRRIIGERLKSAQAARKGE
jgi:uncharacterized membrane protein YebE (DUF533 family)